MGYGSERKPQCAAGVAPANLLPDLEGRQDVEEREPLHPPGMVERQPVSDPGAAVVGRHREADVAQRLHDGDHVPAHGALGIGFVPLVAARRGGPAVAAQVHAHDPVGFRQARRQAVPHGLGLREPVQEHERRTLALGAGEDATDFRVDPVGFETGKEFVAHGAVRVAAVRPGLAPDAMRA